MMPFRMHPRGVRKGTDPRSESCHKASRPLLLLLLLLSIRRGPPLEGRFQSEELIQAPTDSHPDTLKGIERGADIELEGELRRYIYTLWVV